MNWIRSGRVWLAIALSLNATLVAAHFYYRWKAVHALPPSLPSRLPVPSGRTLDGLEVTPHALSSGSCHLARYASARCGYCTRDHEIYLRLERALLQRGCNSLMLAPTDDVFPQPVGAERISVAYTTLAFSRGAALSGTPTTVVTAPDWSILWSKVGAMEPSDVEEATRALGRLKAP